MKKIDLAGLVRKSVEQLEPYVASRCTKGVFLDAGENAFGSTVSARGIMSKLNRYPDARAEKLREELARYTSGASGRGGSISASNIVVGNGSDEVIDLLVRTFAGPGEKIVVLEPSFVIYSFFAQANGVQVEKVLLKANERGFDLDVSAIKKAVDARTKIIFLCSPNNPTGNAFGRRKLLELARKLPCVVVVDEAYAEFTGQTLAGYIKKYANLVVIRTLSKAWGLAGLRVGYAITSQEIASTLGKIKPPYNVNAVSQELAFKALQNKKRMRALVTKILKERAFLERALTGLGFRVFPSNANFLLARAPPGFSSKELQLRLARAGIFVKDCSSMPLLENCLRVTVGTRSENERLTRELKSAIGKPLAGFLIATDVDGTITLRDTIFDFFEKFDLLEKAKALYERKPGSDVSTILDEIASRQRVSERVFEEIADRAELFRGAVEFYSKMEALGARVCFLTSTYEPIARRIAERLKLKKPLICATRVKKRNGLVTGFKGPLIENREKEKALVGVCSETRTPLSKVVGIADSNGDAFFMKRIAEASGLCIWISKLSKPDFSAMEKLVLEKAIGGE